MYLWGFYCRCSQLQAHTPGHSCASACPTVLPWALLPAQSPSF